MIEIIYKEEKKKAEGNESFFKIPNNIRQIGEIKGFQKIYIEDYAYTFLKKISRNAGEGGKAAILFGKYHWAEGNSYLFIKSALEIREMEVSQEHIVFSDKVWGQVYEESKKYFPDQEIAGWFVSLPGFNMQINEMLLKTHLNHFAGNDKTLFVAEPGEWEEAFFLYENNQLIRQSGYYIYYEKNEPMQSYMIAMSQNKSIEETESIPDRAVVDFRKAVRANSETEKETEKKAGSRSWLTVTCAAAAVLAVGITFFNSYRNMQGALGTLLTGISSEKEEETETVSAQSVTGKKADKDAVENQPEKNRGQKPQETKPTEGDGKKAGDEKTGGLESDDQQTDDKDREGETSDIKETADQENPSDPEGKDDGQDTGQETVSVPGKNAVPQEYVIKRGDTLTSICRNKYGSIARMEEICRLNGISPDDIIYAGEKIRLPD